MKRIIAVLVLCLVLLAGCSSETEDSGATSATKKATSLSEALSSKGSYKCTATSGGTPMEIWFKNGKERIEISSSQGKQISLLDGQMMYTWTQGTKTGVKMDVAKIAEMGNQATVQSTEQMNQNAADVDCQPATVSDSLLTPPSDITFTDMTKTLEQLANLPS